MNVMTGSELTKSPRDYRNTPSEDRPPDWRWRTVLWCCNQESIPHDVGAKDEWLRTATRLLSALKASKSKPHTVFRAHPHACGAVILYTCDGEFGLRWAVEWWMLRRLSDSEISLKLGEAFCEAEVTAFRNLFFDVGEHLDDEEYCNRVILEGCAAEDRHIFAPQHVSNYLWKRAALGPDRAIGVFASMVKDTFPGALEAFKCGSKLERLAALQLLLTDPGGAELLYDLQVLKAVQSGLW